MNAYLRELVYADNHQVENCRTKTACNLWSKTRTMLIYIKTNIYLFIIILYESSITDIEYTPNYTATGLSTK